VAVDGGDRQCLGRVYRGVFVRFEAIFPRKLPLLHRMSLASASVGEIGQKEFEVMRIVFGELVRSTPERKRALMERFKQGHVGLMLRALTKASGADIDPRYPLPIALVSVVGAMVLPQLLVRMAGDRSLCPTRWISLSPWPLYCGTDCSSRRLSKSSPRFT
jgi:hypothetical protein